MPPLYVVQQQAKLRVSNRRLIVTIEDGAEQISLTSIPVAQVSQVVLFGNVGLTTPAINILLKHGIDTVFLSKNGEYRGRIVGSMNPHVNLRKVQYQRIGDPHFTLEMAKGFVAAKLHHQRVLLQRHNREQPDEIITTAIQQMAEIARKVPQCADLPSLLGLEGKGSAAYFRGYRRLFSTGWGFIDRNRRPPRDPVNVLLSFGYSLITQLAFGAVQTVGLDPYGGFLHDISYNRPSAALDIVEEFRPVVDGIVLWCCRSGQVTLNHFVQSPAERPVILDEEGKKKFLQAFETRMEVKFMHPVLKKRLPIRQCMIEQARQVAKCITTGLASYQGMGFR